jgi:hypothetical protein
MANSKAGTNRSSAPLRDSATLLQCESVAYQKRSLPLPQPRLDPAPREWYLPSTRHGSGTPLLRIPRRQHGIDHTGATASPPIPACYFRYFAKSSIPWKSTTTAGSPPTTQASWPLGKNGISSGLHSIWTPSSMTTFSTPDRGYRKCGASQLFVFARGWTDSDHFQPGSNIARQSALQLAVMEITRRPVGRLRRAGLWRAWTAGDSIPCSYLHTTAAI